NCFVSCYNKPLITIFTWFLFSFLFTPFLLRKSKCNKKKGIKAVTYKNKVLCSDCKLHRPPDSTFLFSFTSAHSLPQVERDICIVGLGDSRRSVAPGRRARPQHLAPEQGPEYDRYSDAPQIRGDKVIHKTGIPYNPQGQGIVERAHATLKTLLLKLNNSPPSFYKSPHDVLQHALYVLNFLTLDAQGHSAADRFWHPRDSATPMVLWKDLFSNQWNGPDPVLVWGRGHICVFPRSAPSPILVPE
uniref:Integrase catalytic domain-containing protein n=1 Tax=Callithrix jacchus TaxID=9483 RepID=A0A8I3W6H9_CALJA